MRWIRLWTDETINGTTFMELTAEQRGVWWSLLLLAGYSPVPGVICIAPGIPYTREQMAGFLKLPLDVLTRSIEHLTSPDVKKIVINQDGTIAIANWNKYQTEYDRQKGYRRGLQGKVTKKGYTPELQTDEEEEGDVEKEKENKKHGARKRATQLPENFEVTNELRQWGHSLALTDGFLEAETAKFLDYHRSKGSVFKDWNAAWRTWMRKAKEWSKPAPQGNRARAPDVDGLAKGLGLTPKVGESQQQWEQRVMRESERRAR